MYSIRFFVCSPCAIHSRWYMITCILYACNWITKPRFLTFGEELPFSYYKQVSLPNYYYSESFLFLYFLLFIYPLFVLYNLHLFSLVFLCPHNCCSISFIVSILAHSFLFLDAHLSFINTVRVLTHITKQFVSRNHFFLLRLLFYYCCYFLLPSPWNHAANCCAVAPFFFTDRLILICVFLFISLTLLPWAR